MKNVQHTNGTSTKGVTVTAPASEEQADEKERFRVRMLARNVCGTSDGAESLQAQLCEEIAVSADILARLIEEEESGNKVSMLNMIERKALAIGRLEQVRSLVHYEIRKELEELAKVSDPHAKRIGARILAHLKSAED